MQRVTIIGLGLIGGSIGLGLRRWAAEHPINGKPALEITGFSSNLDKQSTAQKIGAVDRTAWDLPKAIADADLVIVCTPVLAMPEIFKDIAPHLKAGAVVTDAGSTKAQVMRWAQEFLPSNIHFVGGHPMAGSTASIEAASADLFVGATWCITPSVNAGEEAVKTVLGLVAALGAEPFFVDPHEHDAYVAGISHLPLVLSASLVNTVAKDPSWRDMKGLAAGGFRDTSRLAMGSPAMQRDILLTNREAVTRWLNSCIANLESVRDQLSSTSDDNAATAAWLTQYFSDAQDARAAWEVQRPRSSEMIPEAAAGAVSESFSEHMGRMFFGGFAKKRTPKSSGDGTSSTTSTE